MSRSLLILRKIHLPFAKIIDQLLQYSWLITYRNKRNNTHTALWNRGLKNRDSGWDLFCYQPYPVVTWGKTAHPSCPEFLSATTIQYTRLISLPGVIKQQTTVFSSRTFCCFHLFGRLHVWFSPSPLGFWEIVLNKHPFFFLQPHGTKGSCYVLLDLVAKLHILLSKLHLEFVDCLGHISTTRTKSTFSIEAVTLKQVLLRLWELRAFPEALPLRNASRMTVVLWFCELQVGNKTGSSDIIFWGCSTSKSTEQN